MKGGEEWTLFRDRALAGLKKKKGGEAEEGNFQRTEEAAKKRTPRGGKGEELLADTNNTNVGL